MQKPKGWEHLALGYFARADVSDQALAQLRDVLTVRLPSIGLFASPLTVQYSWGVARKATYSTYAIDIRRLSHASVGKLASADARSDATEFTIHSGFKNSYLEGAIFEEIFDLSRGRGVSAVAVLNEANETGIGIHQITQENIDAYLAVATTVSPTTRQATSPAMRPRASWCWRQRPPSMRSTGLRRATWRSATMASLLGRH